jgi:hypothetical protein
MSAAVYSSGSISGATFDRCPNIEVPKEFVAKPCCKLKRIRTVIELGLPANSIIFFSSILG